MIGNLNFQSIQVSTKKLNWSQIPVRNIQKSTFWAKTRELDLESQDLFDTIQEEFALKQVKSGKCRV